MSKGIKMIGTKWVEKRERFEGKKIIVHPNAGWKDKALAFVHNNVRFVKQMIVVLGITSVICATVALVFVAPYIFPVLFIWFIYRLVSSSSFTWTKK